MYVCFNFSLLNTGFIYQNTAWVLRMFQGYIMLSFFIFPQSICVNIISLALWYFETWATYIHKLNYICLKLPSATFRDLHVPSLTVYW